MNIIIKHLFIYVAINVTCHPLVVGSSQNAGPGPGPGPGSGSGSGSGSWCLFFFSTFFRFNFCSYSPVLLFSDVRHLSFIYVGN